MVGGQLTDDPLARMIRKRDDEFGEVGNVVEDVMADHDVGRLDGGVHVSPGPEHLVMSDAALVGVGPERTEHPVAGVDTCHEGGGRDQRQRGGPATAPNVEDRAAAGAGRQHFQSAAA